MGIISAFVTLTAVISGIIRGHSKIISYVLLLLLYILFTFEHSDGDYSVYVWLHSAIGPDSNGLSNYEMLYVWATRAANTLNLSFDQFRAIVSILDVTILYYIITKFTKFRALVLALFFIFPATLDAELFRWQTGMFIIFWGTKYILQDRKFISILKYIICVSIAGLFHTACWIFLIYLLSFIKKRKIIICIVCIVLLISLVSLNETILFKIFSFLPIRQFVLEKYTAALNANFDGALFQVLKQLVIFSMILVTYIDFSFRGGSLIIRNDKEICKNDTINDFRSKVLNLNIISFLLLIPLFFSASSQRLVHVIIFYNYIVLANRGSRSNKLFFTILSVIYAVIFLISLLFIEGKQTLYEFSTHFTEGYIINLFNTFLDL